MAKKRNSFFNEETYAIVNKKSKDIVEDYNLELKSKKKAEKTIYQYIADIKMFLCYVHDNFDDKYLLDLKKRDFRRFFLALQDSGASSARINRVQCSLRNILEFCMEDDDEYEDYEINVMKSVKGLVKEEVREIHFLPNEDVELILDYLIEKQKYQQALYLAISYESAGRRNEVHQVKKTDFLENNRTNIVQGKRGKKFSLLYFGRSKEIAKLYFDQRGEDNIDSLWVSGEGEDLRPAKYEALYNWVITFRRILLRLTGKDIEFNPHSLRHTSLENYSDGSHYVLKELGKDKFDINVLRLIANHSDISTTANYLKNKDEEELNNAFGFGS